MLKYNIGDLIAKANNNSCIVTGIGKNKFSISIVNNINGRRVTLSKALCEGLALSNIVYFLPVEETHQLLISASPIGERSTDIALSGNGKKICYNAKLVRNLSACFKLDYTEKTSTCFTDIEVDTSTSYPIAIVNMDVAKSVLSDTEL